MSIPLLISLLDFKWYINKQARHVGTESVNEYFHCNVSRYLQSFLKNEILIGLGQMMHCIMIVPNTCLLKQRQHV